MKKLLVVVDVQNDFLTGPLGNAECAATVPEVIKLIESGEYDAIIATQDTHFDDYLKTQEGRNLPVPHCIRETEGWEIQKDIKKALIEHELQHKTLIILEKPTFGSEILAHKLGFEFTDYDEIHFCGVCTSICVVSNVLIAKAALPETKICVIENACACVTPESHKTAIEAMKMCQVVIIGEDETNDEKRGVEVVFDEEFVKESIADNLFLDKKEAKSMNIKDYSNKVILESIDYHVKRLNGKRPFGLTECCTVKEVR